MIKGKVHHTKSMWCTARKRKKNECPSSISLHRAYTPRSRFISFILSFRSLKKKRMNDALRLESLGYKQELTRSLTRLTNYGMTLSVVSITSGITSLFAYGLITGGPAVMVWGWFVVSLFTLCVSLGMAEICSAYPTAGGLYFWAANLVPEKYKTMASWFTGWFNLVGQFAAVASVDFGLSMLIGSVISIGLGHWSPQRWHIVLIHLVVILSHGLCNSLGPRVLLWITYFSTWWQLIAPLIVTIALFARGNGHHYTGEFLFTNFVNLTGWNSVVSRRTPRFLVKDWLFEGLRVFDWSPSSSILSVWIRFRCTHERRDEKCRFSRSMGHDFCCALFLYVRLAVHHFSSQWNSWLSRHGENNQRIPCHSDPLG